MTQKNEKSHFKPRQFVDRDGFRWWMEEDRDHIDRFINDR